MQVFCTLQVNSQPDPPCVPGELGIRSDPLPALQGSRFCWHSRALSSRAMPRRARLTSRAEATSTRHAQAQVCLLATAGGTSSTGSKGHSQRSRHDLPSGCPAPALLQVAAGRLPTGQQTPSQASPLPGAPALPSKRPVFDQRTSHGRLRGGTAEGLFSKLPSVCSGPIERDQVASAEPDLSKAEVGVAAPPLPQPFLHFSGRDTR